MSKPLRDKYIQRYGKDKWLDHVNKIDSMWNSIEKELDVLNLCYRNVKIYQDGLPNCGNDLSACEDAQLEKNIVNDIAKKGSKNYQLIVRLLDKGANLIGTEDSKLLIEEYKTIRETIQPVGPPAVRQPPSVPERAGDTHSGGDGKSGRYLRKTRVLLQLFNFNVCGIIGGVSAKVLNYIRDQGVCAFAVTQLRPQTSIG